MESLKFNPPEVLLNHEQMVAYTMEALGETCPINASTMIHSALRCGAN